MNVVRCKNGHFFDGDLYDKCPLCGESAVTGGENTVTPKEEKKGFWGRGKKEKEKENGKAAPIYSDQIVTPPISFGKGDSLIKSTEDSIQSNTSLCQLEENPTLDFWQIPSQPKEVIENVRSETENKNLSESEKEFMAPITHEEPEKAEESEEIREALSGSASSLREAIKNASARNEGKTMSYFSAVTASNNNQSQTKQTSEPVVGWLVCVKGFRFGECFSLYAGKNSIGRSMENRVVIADDTSISRIKHAFIVYEPKKRNFYLQPGDSSGLTYLNDDYITESRLLSSHDMVELGDSKFMFVALCGEKFTWEDYIPKGE